MTAILTPSGKDLQDLELRNMLEHWVSNSLRLRRRIRDAGLFNREDRRAIDDPRLLDKARVARMVRAILLDKSARREVVRLIQVTWEDHKTRQPDEAPIEKQLKLIAAELKDLSRMARAGLVAPEPAADPRAPSPLTPHPRARA